MTLTTNQQSEKEYKFIDYTNLSINQVLEKLDVDKNQGLSDQEATARLQAYGLNQLKLHLTSTWQIFIRQFKSPFVYLLGIAMFLSLLLGEINEGVMVGLFVLINAILGFLQEYRSEQAIKQLRKFTVNHCRVIRDHQEQEIDTGNLVPGDVVILNPGVKAPADMRIITNNDLVIDESVLTGESKPVNKHSHATSKPIRQIFEAGNIVFSGTIITGGDGLGVVIATGKQAYIADVQKLTVETIKVTGLEKGMRSFSKFVMWLVLITLGVVLVTNLLIKGSSANAVQLIIFSIALAISAVTEALPLVMTFSLSRGALHLATNKVVVKRLSAIEDLGGIEILCTDKTGTITENKLTIKDFWGSDQQDIWLNARMSLGSEVANLTDAFDLAILNYSGFKQHKLSDYQILG